MTPALVPAALENLAAALEESGILRIPAGAEIAEMLREARAGDWPAITARDDAPAGNDTVDAIAIYLKSLAALVSGGRGAALEELRRITTLTEPPYDILCLAADLATECGDPELALRACDAALEIAPHASHATHRRGLALSGMGDISGAIEALRRATLLQPTHGGAHRALADELRNANLLDNAIHHYRQALSIRPDDGAAEKGLQIALAAAVPPWQMPMLNDTGRNAAFDTAIRRAVRPGMHVLDIGTGTGLLAMMAARAGAAHVTACERVGILAETAERIITDNGFSDRITVLHKSSREIEVGRDLPAPADMLVAEIVDAGLLSEGVLPTFADARARLLKPGAPVIPDSATGFAAPVQGDQVMAMFHCGNAGGFDMSASADFAPRLHLPADLHRLDWHPLARPVAVFSFDFSNPSADPAETEHRIIPLADGTAGAVAFWFTLTLDGETAISTAPDAPATHWQQAVFPLHPPVDLCQNQPVRLIARHDMETIRFEIRT